MELSSNILVAICTLAVVCQADAAPYSATDARMRQQIVQSTTVSAVDTSGAPATALLDARNVAQSRQYSPPTLDEHRADVIAAAVYPQWGPSTAAMGASNTLLSRQLPRQTMKLGTPEAERWMEEAATP